MTDMLDFQTFEKSPKPNCYLVAPAGLCENAEPDEAAPVFAEPPAALFLRVTTLLGDDPQYKDIETDEEVLRLSAVAVTKVLKFKDDVDIAVLPAGEGSTLAIYSRSRVGYSDLGKNKKRVEALLATLKV